MPCSKNESIIFRLNCPKLLCHNLHVLMYSVGLYFLYKYNHRGKTAKFKAFSSWSYLDLLLICFSELFKEYGGRYSRYWRFFFCSSTIVFCRILLKLDLDLKTGKVTLKRQCQWIYRQIFRVLSVEIDPFLFLKTKWVLFCGVELTNLIFVFKIELHIVERPKYSGNNAANFTIYICMLFIPGAAIVVNLPEMFSRFLEQCFSKLINSIISVLWSIYLKVYASTEVTLWTWVIVLVIYA